jgi:hypothetical protein
MLPCKIPAVQKFSSLILLLCACFWDGLPDLIPQARAQSGQVGRLPAGHYIYLDSDPPTKLEIDESGGIHWSSTARLSSQATPKPETARAPAARPVRPQPLATQWEKKEYPVIEWKAHPLTTVPGGVVKLSTRYENGYIKYRLTLFKISELNRFGRTTFQLLDSSGFQVSHVSISNGEFHPVPGTSLLEATGVSSYYERITEPDYQRAADYVVK